MPQEIEVFYILPAIRRELAFAMKRKGKKQKEIAKLLCVKESTISQYFNAKRAASFEFNADMVKTVSTAAENITDKLSMMQQTQAILREFKKDTTICKIHSSLAEVPKGCDVCFIKG